MFFYIKISQLISYTFFSFEKFNSKYFYRNMSLIFSFFLISFLLFSCFLDFDLLNPPNITVEGYSVLIQFQPALHCFSPKFYQLLLCFNQDCNSIGPQINYVLTQPEVYFPVFLIATYIIQYSYLDLRCFRIFLAYCFLKVFLKSNLLTHF